MKFKNIDFSKPWEHKEAWDILTKYYDTGFVEVEAMLQNIGYTINITQYRYMVYIFEMQQEIKIYQEQLKLEKECW